MRVALALGSIGMLCSCGGSADNGAETTNQPVAQAAANQSQACDILTKADAEKALGHEAAKLQTTGGAAGYDICQYGYQGERMMDTGNVSVTVHPVDIASMRKGVADQGYSIEPVNGLGDESFWSKEAGLYVGKGNRTAIYLLGIGGVADTKDKTIELAKSTVGRL